MASDFNVDVQKLFLGIMLSDAESFVRVQNIYNADNFDKSIKAAAKFIKEYSDEHKVLPDVKRPSSELLKETYSDKDRNKNGDDNDDRERDDRDRDDRDDRDS